ncbi:ParB/RepB/Spo0J family partition protein [Cellulomonas sp. JH27-2]|uniref:ParB/RepB/Spo0J family partition protein n=1 Tax=Cellulomonas sp. JH27-2 TaxID=2774139 RepID=UPI0017805B08|nr:ParB/RepB/Spo0J family partition protein [Cellulomonas sp. JH27-2]MBD8058263.1 ParB/RepB/Spo0J family partition protein [Cellulomonas sp. JH27-2]
MSEKRRGLGRGLGALIPTSAEGEQRPTTGERPADLFFGKPRAAASDAGAAASAADAPTAASPAAVAPVAPSASGEGVAGGTSNGATSTALADGAISADPGVDAENESPPTTNGTPAGGAPSSADVASPDATAPSGAAAENGAGASLGGSTAPSADVLSDDGLVPVPGARFAELPVGDIRPNPRQPRTVFDEDALAELVGSIKEIGVLQPVVVRQVSDGYELIMGERRWRATQEAGLTTIPAIIRETGDNDLLRDALLENLHRSQLNPLEEAAAYQQLLDDFGCTHDQLATRISRSRPQISNTLRLLKLPPLVQRRVAAGVLSAGHARALLGLSDGAAIERLAQRIVAEGLSVRAVEEIVALGADDAPRKRAAPRAGIRNEALDDLASRLSDRFETRVKVSLGKSRGRLTVEFASVQDLNRILGSLAPEDPGLLKN